MRAKSWKKIQVKTCLTTRTLPGRSVLRGVSTGLQRAGAHSPGHVRTPGSSHAPALAFLQACLRLPAPFPLSPCHPRPEGGQEVEVPGETDWGEQEGTASLGHRTGPLHGGPQETAREP